MKLSWITISLATLASMVSTTQAGALAEAADCRQALDRLQVQEESRSAEHNSKGARAEADLAVEDARRKAAKACLGGPAEAPPAAARLQAPLSVVPIAPIDATSPSAVGQIVPLPGRAAPAAIRPPTTVNHCDSAGCWTSDGVYLMRVGPDLIGPPGLCTVQANLLFCR